jgi:hypothetical protein
LQFERAPSVLFTIHSRAGNSLGESVLSLRALLP